LARPAKSPPLPDAAQPAALQGLGRIALHQRTLPTRYTGQYIYANDFGLVFYNARWDDPLLASWAQPDTLIPQNQGTQAWDRYAYVNNSPVNYNDPPGHRLVLCTAAIGGAIGTIVGAVGYTAYTVATGTEFNTGQLLWRQEAARLLEHSLELVFGLLKGCQLQRQQQPRLLAPVLQQLP
jgi:RHS repeat-associated protein